MAPNSARGQRANSYWQLLYINALTTSNSRLTQRQTNHYMAQWTNILAWSWLLAGRWSAQFVIDLFGQHRRFSTCFPYIRNIFFFQNSYMTLHVLLSAKVKITNQLCYALFTITSDSWNHFCFQGNAFARLLRASLMIMQTRLIL